MARHRRTPRARTSLPPSRSYRPAYGRPPPDFPDPVPVTDQARYRAAYRRLSLELLNRPHFRPGVRTPDATPCRMPKPIGNVRRLRRLRDQAVALRRDGLSRRQIRDRLQVHNNDILNRLLDGEPRPGLDPPPERQGRPARTGPRAAAAGQDLRPRSRWSWGCSKSSISLWVRDLPKPPPRTRRRRPRAIARRGWERDPAKPARRGTATDQGRCRREIGDPDGPGAVPARRGALLGGGHQEQAVPPERGRHLHQQRPRHDPGSTWPGSTCSAWSRSGCASACMIHESADVAAAERYWADLVGGDVADFDKTTLKKHNPKTVRKNVGDAYRRLPRDPRPAKRRPIPSHRGLVVRHSVGCRVGRPDQNVRFGLLCHPLWCNWQHCGFWCH